MPRALRRSVRRRQGDSRVPPHPVDLTGQQRMRVLITGHEGYIGTILRTVFAEAGHDVVGLDTGYFRGCVLGPEPPAVPSLELDLRDVEPAHLAGFDVVVHLGALSNDPLGDLSPTITYD